MNRRGVVQTLILGAAVIPAARPHMAAVIEPRDAPLHARSTLLIVDNRYPAARQFARDGDRQRHAMVTFDGDVTSLWHEVLDRGWHDTMDAMLGMTTANAHLCLEQLLADRFWRTTQRRVAGDLMVWALAPLKGVRR